MTRAAEKWLSIAALIAAATGGPALARAEGLSGLEAKLNATGRVGTWTPQGGGIPAATPDAAAAEKSRDPSRALTRIEDDSAATEAAARAPSVPSPTVADAVELERTDSAVAACRVEVARRRRVPPAKVAAGTVVLRFTIEKNGQVREAEALSAIDTDLEVAACAKRVLSGWTFTKRARDALVVERSYRFSRG